LPDKRAYDVWIHCSQPKAVTVNGVKIDWQYDPRTKAAHGTVTEDVSRKAAVVIHCEL
jgi:hypothetical protein